MSAVHTGRSEVPITGGQASPSPSPRPSPWGRGRIGLRWLEMLNAFSSSCGLGANGQRARHAISLYERLASSDFCSLSLRERVRARGNGAFDLRSRSALNNDCPQRFSSASDSRTPPSPSPRPSPWGRGRIALCWFEMLDRFGSSCGLGSNGQKAEIATGNYEQLASLDCCSLSLRERVRVRGNSARSLNSAWFHSWLHRPAILRHGLGRPLLQRVPNGVPDDIFFTSQPAIPKAKHFDSTSRQPSIAFHVALFGFRRSVLPAVEFDIERGFQTKEIEYVGRIGMLSAEFVCGESPITKPLPKKLFSPRVALTKSAGDLRELGRSHGGILPKSACSASRKFSSPSPRPSPAGRGRIAFRWFEILDAFSSSCGLGANGQKTEIAVASCKLLASSACGSLSPRERVRVRGNGAFDLRNRCALNGERPRQFSSVMRSGAVPSPSPRPSPRGRGRIAFRWFEMLDAFSSSCGLGANGQKTEIAIGFDV